MGAVRLLTALGAAAITTACGGGERIGPATTSVPTPSGIYVLNEASNEQSTTTAYVTGLDTAAAYLHDVDGHAIFVPIAKILPGITTWGQFDWTWGYLDSLVQSALSHQKKFSLELETGFQNTNTYLRSLPAGFTAVCGTDCAPLFDVWTIGGGGGRCISAYVPLPWVPRVQQFWGEAASALAAHLHQINAYGSLTLVHVPGLSVYDEEIRLPTGSPKPATTDTLPCPDGRPAYPTVLTDADTSVWRGLGYSDSAVVSGFTTIAAAFHRAFPDRFLGLSLFNPASNGIDFPNLGGDPVGFVAARIVQAVSALAPGHVQLQADNLDTQPVLSEVMTLASQDGDSVGWQSNKHAGTGAGCNGGGTGTCGPDGSTSPYVQLLQNGSQNRGEYVEIWSADVLAYQRSLDAVKTAGLYPVR